MLMMLDSNYFFDSKYYEMTQCVKKTGEKQRREDLVVVDGLPHHGSRTTLALLARMAVRCRLDQVCVLLLRSVRAYLHVRRITIHRKLVVATYGQDCTCSVCHMIPTLYGPRSCGCKKI